MLNVEVEARRLAPSSLSRAITCGGGVWHITDGITLFQKKKDYTGPKVTLSEFDRSVRRLVGEARGSSR